MHNESGDGELQVEDTEELPEITDQLPTLELPDEDNNPGFDPYNNARD